MKRITALFLVAAMLILAAPFTFSTVVNAQTVSNEEQLKAAITADGAATITLDADFTINTGDISGFEGTLDGNGHTITLTGEPLFGTITSATVKDLTLAGSVSETINAANKKLAALAREAKTSLTLSNVVNKADVTFTYDATAELKGGYVAGLIGWVNEACVVDITDCINEGTVSALAPNGAQYAQTVHAGGFIGGTTKAKGTISRCINKGKLFIDGPISGAGGIVGYTNNSTTSATAFVIEYCANLADLNGKAGVDGNVLGNRNERTAGICGYMSATIVRYCYNTGMIYDDNAYGIAGYGNANNKNWRNEVYCNYTYSSDKLTAELGRYKANTIIGGQCYVYGNYIMENRREIHTAEITSTPEFKDGVETGKTYYTANTIVRCDRYEPANVYRNAEDLLAQLDADEAVAGIWVEDTQNINKGYPVFAWQVDETPSTSAELGTVEIASYEALATALASATTAVDTCYKLTADITVPANFTQIADFYDVLDGNGHTITLDKTTKALINNLYGTIQNVTFAGETNISEQNTNLVTVNKGDRYINNVRTDNQKSTGFCSSGVIANEAIGATLSYVASTVDAKATFTRDGTGTAGTVFGGFIGTVYANSDGQGTTLVHCTNNGAVTVNYPTNENYTRDMVAGLVAVALGKTRIAYCRNNADIITVNSRGNVGGLMAFVTHSESVTSSVSPARIYISYSVNAGDFKNTGHNNERAGGIVGCGYAFEIKYCYNVGKPLSGNNKAFVGIHGWAQTYNDYRKNLTVYGCYTVDTSNAMTQFVIKEENGKTENYHASGFIFANNFHASTQAENGVNNIFNKNVYNHTLTTIVSNANGGTTKVANTTVKGYGAYHYEESTTYTDAADLTTKIEANMSTAAYYTADTCNINNGYPILTWEAHDYVTLYEEGGKNYVTTGKDLDCDKYNNAEFAGFVQFTNNKQKARFIMAIDTDYLATAKQEFDSFDVVITFNGNQTARINSRTLTSYYEVTAGTDVYTADGCEIFGFIVNFGDTTITSVDLKIEIGQDTFELGSYTAN